MYTKHLIEEGIYMEASNAPLNLNVIITAVAVFLFIDLFLRQVVDKMSLTSQYKVDSLVNAIRPSLQILEKAIANKKIEEKEKTELISLINKIKPMPLKAILKLANEIPIGEIDGNEKIQQLNYQLIELKKSSIRYVSSYMLGFERLETAGPISSFIALFSVSICWGWIPTAILAFCGMISWRWFVIFIVSAIIYEFYIRKGL
jgi:hypothetical protein